MRRSPSLRKRTHRRLSAPTATSGTDPLAARNPLRYRGYYYDTETGLYYLPARYYEPRSARFLSVDPAPAKAWDPVSFNRYSYCFGDPVNRWDPTGADSPKDGPYDAPVWYNDAFSDAISRSASPDDAIRAGETAAAAAEAMRRAFLTPEQRALEDMRAAANRAAVSAAWASMSSGPLVNRASPERFMPGRASPGGFSSIVNVNGPGGMREMGQRFASIPTTSFALVGYGAFHGVLAVGCFIAATGAVTATTVTVPFTGGLSMAGGVPIAAGLYAAAALNATSALGLTLAGVYTAKHGM